MIDALQLYGTFILTMVGFVVPILAILISIFPEGIRALSLKYENERIQSDENITNEIAKKETTVGLDYVALEKTLKTLKKKKRDAELKLSYLRPNHFLLRTATPFVVSFVAVLISLMDIGITATIIAITSSFVSLTAGLLSLLTSIAVLFEVAEIVNQAKTGKEDKIIDLLSTLVEKEGESLYLKEGSVRVKFNNNELKEDLKLNFSVDKKYEIPISIFNKSEKMARLIEVGLIFPKSVVIEKTNNISSITPTKDAQIVRFKEDGVQAYNDTHQGKLQLTFLEPRLIISEVFIKGENVKYQRFKFQLNIVK